MAAGFRSLAGFWFGGASASPIATQAGVRSPLAFWLGGASAPTAAATQAGYRSLLAFWMGGASAGAGETETEPGGGAGRRIRPQARLRRLDDVDVRPARQPPIRQAPGDADDSAGAPRAGLVDGRFDAAELAAVFAQVTPTGSLPPLVRLPTRTIEPATATEDDMALLAFVLFMAMDDD